MVEWFKGVKGLFDRRSEEEKQLEAMIEQYGRDKTEGHEALASGITFAMAHSPDLKARTLDAIRTRHLRGYSDDAVDGHGAASYQPREQVIRIPPGFHYTPREYMDLIFLLGHETEHARSRQSTHESRPALGDAFLLIARGPPPRDYTEAVHDYAERVRAEEGNAHIGGFNALASYVITQQNPRPGHLLRDLYEAHPARMKDFIDRNSVGIPPTYTFKEGLTPGPDGLLPYSHDNIEAMKVHYADKAQLGAPHLNYRQEAIAVIVEAIEKNEALLAEAAHVDRDYIIDPERLRAHPELRLPADGQFQAIGAPIPLTRFGPITVYPPPAHGAAETSSARGSDTDAHPLFAQALVRITALDALTPPGTAQDTRNLAAALAVSAQAHGLHRIDEIAHSVDGLGLIAIQGEGESSVHARVERLAAIATPEQDSLARLGSAKAPTGPSAEHPAVIPELHAETQAPGSRHH